MSLSASGWANKVGTTIRNHCSHGSWKQHWINTTGKNWPTTCSVSGCYNTADVGGHVYHGSYEGERIAPICSSCNKQVGKFSFKDGTSLPKAVRDSCIIKRK